MFQKPLSLIVFLLFTSFLTAQDWAMKSQVIASLGNQTVKAYIHPIKKKERNLNKGLVYYYYYKGKLFHTQGGYTGYLLDGKVDIFDKEDRLVEQGQYNKGIKIGQWREWRTNGMLKEVSHWKSGRLDGKQEQYNERGEKTEVTHFKKGILHGKRYIYENGRKVEWVKYRRGREGKTKDLSLKVKESKKIKERIKDWKSERKKNKPQEEDKSSRRKKSKSNKKNNKKNKKD